MQRDSKGRACIEVVADGSKGESISLPFNAPVVQLLQLPGTGKVQFLPWG